MMPKPDPEKYQHDTNPDLLQKAVYQLLEQISKRDQKLIEKDAQLLYMQAQLMEKEAQHNEIVTSKAWKIMLFVQKARIFLGSPQSRRVQMLRRGLEIISSLFKKTGRS
jgi:hypothetical protein